LSICGVRAAAQRRAALRDLGSVSTEYALLALFIAIAVVAAITIFGAAVLGLFESGTDEAVWNAVP
jgi:Flp pilus assembly pilin Flp